MGGSSSRQSVSASTSVAAKIVQDTIQDCLVTAVGGNTVNISGSGNNLSDVTQKVSISVNSNCQALSSQSSSFQNAMQNSVSQNLRDQSVALTQWMDNSSRNTSTQLSQSVSTELDQKMVQNCTSKLNGQNIIAISGDNNTVKNVVQDATLSLIAKCLQQNGQAGNVISQITNSVNQHQEAVSANPLAFIGDAFKAIFSSVAGIAAAAFVLIVCLILLYKAVKHVSKSKKIETPVSDVQPAHLSHTANAS